MLGKRINLTDMVLFPRRFGLDEAMRLQMELTIGEGAQELLANKVNSPERKEKVGGLVERFQQSNAYGPKGKAFLHRVNVCSPIALKGFSSELNTHV